MDKMAKRTDQIPSWMWTRGQILWQICSTPRKIRLNSKEKLRRSFEPPSHMECVLGMALPCLWNFRKKIHSPGAFLVKFVEFLWNLENSILNSLS